MAILAHKAAPRQKARKSSLTKAEILPLIAVAIIFFCFVYFDHRRAATRPPTSNPEMSFFRTAERQYLRAVLARFGNLERASYLTLYALVVRRPFRRDPKQVDFRSENGLGTTKKYTPEATPPNGLLGAAERPPDKPQKGGNVAQEQ